MISSSSFKRNVNFPAENQRFPLNTTRTRKNNDRRRWRVLDSLLLEIDILRAPKDLYFTRRPLTTSPLARDEGLLCAPSPCSGHLRKERLSFATSLANSCLFRGFFFTGVDRRLRIGQICFGICSESEGIVWDSIVEGGGGVVVRISLLTFKTGVGETRVCEGCIEG